MEGFSSTVPQHAKVYASSGKEYAFGFGRFCVGEERRPKNRRSWSMSVSHVKDILDWLAG
jgi:hypothetical protein